MKLPRARKPNGIHKTRDEVIEHMLSLCVRLDSGCIIYPGGLTKGYAKVKWHNGERYMSTGLHTAIAERKHGGPLGDLVPDHACENKACINVNHLDIVTQLENVRRFQYRNNRKLRTQCPQGHPYDDANTWVDKRGYRYCRACMNERGRARREKQRMANA